MIMPYSLRDSHETPVYEGLCVVWERPNVLQWSQRWYNTSVTIINFIEPSGFYDGH